MFFKRLEMVGFKSFATKTVIEFLPGITVIVGPNGCGKSNIFDAVRWALGEQRPRSLRGQKMGDVIFAGSASYKAQAMASVALVVNNEDRRLPIDFSEVQVARRLYKVGADEYESEYLLNRTACRLRQITDLFMDTGVGTDSYSIMEQGQVDFIINARPSERRFLFDEAVGISKYRTRREEALRRLERTEADLLRLGDILSELKTRLRSLKIQANRAERYKQLVGELRQLERNLLLLAYKELVIQKRAVDAEFDERNAALQGLVAQMARLEQSMLDRQLEVERLEREVQAAHLRRAERKTELERAQSQRAVLRERIETTETQMRRDETQIRELRQLRDQTVERRERVGLQVREVTEELSRLESEHKARRDHFDELLRSQSDARERLVELREKTRQAVEEKTRQENERRIASLMKQQADENLAQARSQLEQAATGHTALGECLERLEDERTAQNESVALLEAQVERLESAERERAEQLRALEQEKATAVGLRHEAESRRQALRTLQENYEGYVRGVREVMSAAGRGEIGGIVGIVANLLESSPENEFAIETALAAHLQDIVVESESDALAGIEFLRSGQIGRATFLPLDRLACPPSGPTVKALVGRPGVVGMAVEIVRTHPRLRPVAEMLLGHTVIVGSVETAQGLRAKGHQVRYVTRDGTILAADGAVTGGHVRPSGLFGREREIRELGERIQELDRKIAGIETRIEEHRAAIEATAAERETLNGKINSARNALVHIESEIRRTTDDRSQAQRALEQANHEVERLTQKINEYERSLEEHQCILEESHARAAELEAQLTEGEMARESHDQQVNLLQEALAHLMAQASAARERLESSQRRLTELDDEVARCEEQIGQHTQHLDSLSQSLDQACAEIEGTKHQIEQLTMTLEEDDRVLTERSSERDTASAETQRLQHELHALQRQRNEQQNEMHEIDRRRAQCEIQCQNLDDQAREKFRSPIEQLAQAAGTIEASREQLVNEIAALRTRIESMGEVNVIAIEEHRQLSERYEFLERQRTDLEEAKASLLKTIRTIDETTTEMFTKGMTAIRQRFHDTFRRLFGGGRADLILTEPEDLLNSGIEILAQPPGKHLQSITLLSGGEKAMTAIALLFGIFLYRPSPFCVLDEIDASLDDANIERFKSMVLEFSKDVQFIIITHNKQTMALADTLYGVTMEEAGVSRIVSVRFDQVEQTALVG